MNKSQSKYFHTAKRMDEAFLALLEKKEFELITVNDICKKAEVNRSTFYLHYENTYDLLKECVEGLGEKFAQKFTDQTLDVQNASLEELVLIDERNLRKYLEFVRENQRIFKALHEHPDLFGTGKAYESMFDTVFNPILKRFGRTEEDNRYIMEYFSHGLSALILSWAKNGCKKEIEKIVELILLCVRPTIER